METREVQDKRRTVSFAASAEGTKVVFSENYKYYHFRNDGGGTVYVSAYSDVGEGVDGTKSISDGGCGYVFSCDDHVFVKGAAKITVEASNLPECPFKSAQRGGDITLEGGAIELYSGALSSDSSSPTVFEADLSAYSALIICTKSERGAAVQYCPSVVIPTSKLSDNYLEFSLYSYVGSTQRLGKGYIKHESGKLTVYSYTNIFTEITVYGQLYGKEITPTEPIGIDVAAEGNPVQLDGLQGGVPFSEMVVSGKNLLTYPYNETTKTVNGITFTDNGDGSVTVKGTATARCAFWLKQSVDNFVLPKNTPIYISAAKEQIPNVNIGCGLINGTTWISSKAFPITGAVDAFDYENFDRLNFNITVDPGSTVDVTLYPQIELGSTPTEYEPTITGRELTVSVSGKNLLPTMPNSVTRNGITYAVNADGTITLNGTAEKADGVDIVTKIPLKAGVYTLTGCPKGGSETTFALRAGLGTANTLYGRDYGNGLKITTETDTTITVTIQNAEIGRVFDNVVYYPQLELGDTATAYEPYHGSTTTITPDSNPYTVPNDIRQQDGLNNISVSEGEISVTGVRKNAAIKRIWDEIDEIKTAIIVSNGETE